MKNKFWPYLAPAIAWALVLFILSSISHLPSSHYLGNWEDKVDHVAAYAILGALVLRALTMNREVPGARDMKLTLALGIFYGVTDEFHQYFVPGRFMDNKDLVADAVGVIAGMLFYLWLCKRRSLRQKVKT